MREEKEAKNSHHLINTLCPPRTVEIMAVPIILVIFVALVATASSQQRSIKMVNRCDFDIWINPEPNEGFSQLPEGIQKVVAGQEYTYPMADGGWGGRFHPK